jgi:hypothetical protein
MALQSLTKPKNAEKPALGRKHPSVLSLARQRASPNVSQPACAERAAADEQCADARLDKRRESRVEFPCTCGLHHEHSSADRSGGSLHVSHLHIDFREVWVQQHADQLGFGNWQSHRPWGRSRR